MADGQIKLGDLGLGRFLGMQSVAAFSQVGGGGSISSSNSSSSH